MERFSRFLNFILFAVGRRGVGSLGNNVVVVAAVKHLLNSEDVSVSH